jgi:predicted Holliday junction resolvase-like endonuclease
MAAILLFDTLKFSKRLINVGMPAAQAEELAEVQKEAFEESLNNGIASKEDIALLDKKIENKIEETRTLLREEITLVNKTMQKLNGKLSVHDWMLRFLLGLMLAMFAKMFF